MPTKISHPFNLPIAAFDLDNCLSDDSWRIPYIDWSAKDPDVRYRRYHAEGWGDTPHNIDLFKRICEVHRPIFITARPESVFLNTRTWITANFGVQHPIIFMRRLGDHRSSVELKRAIVSEQVLVKIDIAFDDRQDIVDMYEELGISAKVLKIHDVCAMTPPARRRDPASKDPELLAGMDRCEALEAAQAAKAFTLNPTIGKVDEMPDAPPTRGTLPPAPRKPRTAGSILADSIDTHRARAALYGDNYKNFGPAMAGMFPRGLALRSPEDFARLGVFVQLLSKLSRYANNLESGGHVDSAHDMIVYAALLEELSQAAPLSPAE